LVINEETREKLGLRVEEARKVTLADGINAPGGITEPVKKNRLAPLSWSSIRHPCKMFVSGL
jgi:hypothetical protein